jgi:hypothetical protein
MNAPEIDTRHEEEARRLLAVASRDGVPAFIRAAAALPPDDVFPVCFAALTLIRGQKHFNRIGRALARWENPAGVEALIAFAQTQKRLPKRAIQAIAHSRHEAAADALVKLLQSGRGAQVEAAAESLAARNDIRAVGPLCRIIRASDGRSRVALAAIRKLGRPADIARRIVTETRMPAFERLSLVRELSVLTVYRFPLASAPFDPERWLERDALPMAERVSPAMAVPVREVQQLLQEERTLLRASSGGTAGDTLLRAARGAGAANADALLRASDAVSTPEGRRAGLNALPGRLLGMCLSWIRIRC